MKIKLILILLASIVSVFADNEKIESLTTLKGKTYTGLSITKQTAHALHFIHKSGVGVVPFEDLSKELQEEYDYDPVKAEKFKIEEAIRYAKSRQRRAKAGAKERIRYNKSVAERKEQEKKNKANKELLKIAKKNAFFVKQVVENGLLVNNVHIKFISSVSRLGAIGGGGGGNVSEHKSAGSDIYFVEGHPDKENVVDGKYIEGVFYEKGSYSYVDVLGEKRTVKKFIYLENPKKK
jgi:hypothetical protein